MSKWQRAFRKNSLEIWLIDVSLSLSHLAHVHYGYYWNCSLAFSIGNCNTLYPNPPAAPSLCVCYAVCFDQYSVGREHMHALYINMIDPSFLSQFNYGSTYIYFSTMLFDIYTWHLLCVQIYYIYIHTDQVIYFFNSFNYLFFDQKIRNL